LWEFKSEQVRWIILSLFCSAARAAVLSPIATRRYDKKRSAFGIYTISIVFGALPILLRLVGWFPPTIRRGCSRSCWSIRSSR
jgi:hypothetical protein